MVEIQANKYNGLVLWMMLLWVFSFTTTEHR